MKLPATPKQVLIFILTVCIFAFSSCEKIGSEEYTITGKAQKGPFVPGTVVTLNELSKTLGQTGKSFTTNITSEDGSFELAGITLSSSLTLLTANGFYFSEIYGESSGAPLSLQAVADLDGKESLNINVLTHLIKDRIGQLVSDGLSFREASDQAEDELIEFLGSGESMDISFEDLDISREEDYNAILLAVSLMVQRYTNVFDEFPGLTAELTELLSHLSSDLRDNGHIDDRDLVEVLLFNISQLNLIDIRRTVEEKYSSIDPSAIIPEFEEYLARFQEKHNSILYSEFYFPEWASAEPVLSPEIKLRNILDPGDSIYFSGDQFSIAAFCPLRSSLTIKIIANNESCSEPECNGPLNGVEVDGYSTGGWEVIKIGSAGYELRSQRQNALMVTSIFFSGNGEAIVEFYKDDSETPFQTKRISWWYP